MAFPMIRRILMPDIKLQMQKAMDSSAVLKMKFIALRGRMQNVNIFAFEGVDDKFVYYHWIKQLKNDLEYVPFLCGGKGDAIKLMNSLERDVNGLRNRVYFFIDRDYDQEKYEFDGLYVTSFYSFENYLARSEVLAEILKNDFHLHGRPDLIAYIDSIYCKLEGKFFEIVRDLNLVLFVASSLKIKRNTKLPDRIGALADIEIDDINSKFENVFELIDLERNPTLEEVNLNRGVFDKLDPRDRYRGKFNILFFKRFLEIIYQEIKKPNDDFFKNALQDGLVPKLNLTIDTIASRSKAPKCFSTFINNNFSIYS